jgi:hypothetical protein
MIKDVGVKPNLPSGQCGDASPLLFLLERRLRPEESSLSSAWPGKAKAAKHRRTGEMDGWVDP